MTDALSWQRIHNKLKNDKKIIFEDYIPSTMTDLEKRRLVFNYVFNNVKYDKLLYKELIELKNQHNLKIRNTNLELEDTIFNHKGIYNGITEYYKLLLNEIGINSIYANYHSNDEFGISAVCLIYDAKLIKDNELSFAFDDIVSAIINNDKDKYFNYNLDTAHKYGQGNNNDSTINWNYLTDYYIYRFLFKKSIEKDTYYKKHCLKKSDEQKVIERAKLYLNNELPYYDANV